jgi:LacI family transcriptional regulator
LAALLLITRTFLLIFQRGPRISDAMKARLSARRDPRPAIALLVETSNQYSRQLLRGIRDYVREQGPWALYLTEQGRGDVIPPWLETWRGDGIIARIENSDIERAVRAIGVPVVNVSASGLAPEFPTVISDSKAVAGLAAGHLLERGFRHFGYCGDSRFVWSASHGRHFAAHVRQAGHTCEVFASSTRDFADWRKEQQRLGDWLLSLPKPVGIMTCYDIRGQQVLNVCRHVELRVPEEVAVISQHNDEPLCELCDPPLSSVIPNPRRAGYQASELLARMMRGRRMAARVYHIPPIGVKARQSTDAVMVEDAEIAVAVRFIRENASRGIGVDDVMHAARVSRSMLERRFQAQLGYTPYEAIQRARLARAKELLATTALPIAHIADLAGFSSAEYFSASFKSQVGASPRQFRASSRVAT